jgi:predicted nucleic acid-binding protein
MSRYLLDSGPLAAYLNGRDPLTEMIDSWRNAFEAATSMLVYGEIIEYLKGRPNFSIRQEDLLRLLEDVIPFGLTYPVMERYADIRRQLRPPYGPGLIGDVDALIAATALEHDLTVVTMDSDFQRVPGLQVQLIDVRS